MSLPAPRAGLTYREDYFDDAAGWHSVKQLLRDIFDVDIDPIDLYGGHDRTSMACAWFDGDGRVVANLSAFAMPLMTDGRVVNAAGWQSGAVRPEYRGKGLYRDIMRQMLDRCAAAGFEAIVLLTDKPALYEPYGFSVLPQHVFQAEIPSNGINESSRTLDLSRPEDVALLSRALERRVPVSERFSVTDQSRLFLLNCHLVENIRLDQLECGAIVAWRFGTDGIPELLDIVSGNIPSLKTIGASLGMSGRTIRIGFPPDRIDAAASARSDDGDLVFMIRGSHEFRPKTQFCLSPMAEF